jgi:hypothetical protein
MFGDLRVPGTVTPEIRVPMAPFRFGARGGAETYILLPSYGSVRQGRHAGCQ